MIRSHANEVGCSIPTDDGPGLLAVAPDGSVVRYSTAALAAKPQASTVATAMAASPDREATA